MKIPFDLAKKYHRYMWRWLARNPEEEKTDWPGLDILEERYGETRFDCFACEIAIAARGYAENGEHFCEYCPLIEWQGRPAPGMPTTCGNGGSKYLKWLDESKRNNDMRSQLAMEIANTEWVSEERFNQVVERNNDEEPEYA